MVRQEGNRLVIEEGAAKVVIECWGEDSLRVRMTAEPVMDANDWALCEPVKEVTPVIAFEEVDTTDPWYRGSEWEKYHQTGMVATLTNGKITARVSAEGWISYLNDKGEILTEEYWRNRNRINRYCVPLRVDARELKPIKGSSDYELTARFEAYDDEKIFGMGQYQEKHLNKKGAVLELAHRNSQASVPFFCVKQGIRLFLEQSCNRDGELWHEQNGVVCKEHQKAGLFYYGGRYAGGYRAQLQRGGGTYSHDAGVWPGVLAVQAALPQSGGASFSGERA